MKTKQNTTGLPDSLFFAFDDDSIIEKKEIKKSAPTKKVKHKKVVEKPAKKQKPIVLKNPVKTDLKIDIWAVDKELYKIYAENKEFIEKLGKILKRPIDCIYNNEKSKPFGWDLFFDKKDLTMVKKLCKSAK
jgi:hypothetical protein